MNGAETLLSIIVVLQSCALAGLFALARLAARRTVDLHRRVSYLEEEQARRVCASANAEERRAMYAPWMEGGEDETLRWPHVRPMPTGHSMILDGRRVG